MVAGPVAPGTGWPGDPATAATPVATARSGARAGVRRPDAGGADRAAIGVPGVPAPRRLAGRGRGVRRKSFATEQYWGRPSPAGDPAPSVLIVGLAPRHTAATDRAGLHRRPQRRLPVRVAVPVRARRAADERPAGDGQRLIGARMVAAVAARRRKTSRHPANATPARPGLTAELRMVAASLRVIVVPRRLRLAGAVARAGRRGLRLPRPRPRSARREVGCRPPAVRVLLIGCYHPSQQNTFTGRVTGDMTDAIFTRARDYRG